jgi:prolyl-tRNA synthetase
MEAPGSVMEKDLQEVVDSRTSFYARADEMHEQSKFDEIPENKQVVARGIEVGHIFQFGDKYSKPMNANVQGANGKVSPVMMGSYGIGVSRLVGGIIEANHDENGIVWPKSVTPFGVGIINLKVGNDDVDRVCEELYEIFEKSGIEPLYDDKNDRGGQKFARMDLIGLPYQIIVGPRGLQDGIVEVKTRISGKKKDLSFEEAVNYILSEYKSVI